MNINEYIHIHVHVHTCIQYIIIVCSRYAVKMTVYIASVLSRLSLLSSNIDVSL